jgi:hypothetical protein
MKFLIMQFSPTSCHFVSLWSKYSPPHPVSTVSLCSSLNVRDQVSHPYRTTGNIIVLYILTFIGKYPTGFIANAVIGGQCDVIVTEEQ